mmetsp:Transcript_34576/g.108371  ORF Transcript_34576/g.108371 Transcript_34576/m.108371 type:complete len:232 (-) Transcript_34576:454-1149(-)
MPGVCSNLGDFSLSLQPLLFLLLHFCLFPLVRSHKGSSLVFGRLGSFLSPPFSLEKFVAAVSRVIHPVFLSLLGLLFLPLEVFKNTVGMLLQFLFFLVDVVLDSLLFRHFAPAFLLCLLLVRRSQCVDPLRQSLVQLLHLLLPLLLLDYVSLFHLILPFDELLLLLYHLLATKVSPNLGFRLPPSLCLKEIDVAHFADCRYIPQLPRCDLDRLCLPSLHLRLRLGELLVNP